MTTTTEIKQVAMHQAVEAGAALLDREQPGWAGRVDLVTLNLALCTECVLGQLFGDYHAARHRLSGTNDSVTSIQWAIEHGFTLMPGEPSVQWSRLRELWVEQIEARR